MILLGRRACVVPAVVASLVLAGGCGAAERPDVTPKPVPASATASIPSDGIALSSYGFTNGPVRAFSIPRNSLVVTSVDQPNVVTLVLSSPAPAEIASYLRTTLPGAGFEITADDQQTDTLTFDGYGWTGSFTASVDRGAIRLSPS